MVPRAPGFTKGANGQRRFMMMRYKLNYINFILDIINYMMQYYKHT